MIWQDYLMTVGGCVLAASLVPTAFGRFRPGRSSSVPMTVVLASYVVAMGTLSLWMSAGTIATQVVMWAVIAVRGPTKVPPSAAAIIAFNTPDNGRKEDNYGFS